jgi:hypothetical protein
MLSKSFVLLSLLALASASPMAAYSNMVVHNAREAVPAGFKMTGPAPTEKTFDLRIAMTSNNMDGLQKALYDVSTPGSPNYGKFLSKEQVSSPPTSSILSLNDTRIGRRIRQALPGNTRRSERLALHQQPQGNLRLPRRGLDQSLPPCLKSEPNALRQLPDVHPHRHQQPGDAYPLLLYPVGA